MSVSNRRYIINTTGPLTSASWFWIAYTTVIAGALLGLHWWWLA